MSVPPGTRRRARGEIERLPSGSLRVRVYDGLDPVSKKRRYLVETVAAGPTAEREAAEIRDRLLAEAAARRSRRRSRSVDLVGGKASTGEVGDVGPVDEPVSRPRRGRRRGELTVATVARIAGVSAPTVSKVLNGRTGVAPETRQRVEALLREHGYRRPEMVQRTPGVEVVFFGMQNDLAVEIMRGVEQVAAEHKLAVSFLDVMRQISAGHPWAENLLGRRPTGVITVNLGFTPAQQFLLRAGAIPLVVLDPSDQPMRGVPSVVATNWSGGIDAARHLLDLGHRRIAVITGPTERLAAKARLEGARTAMEAAGQALDARLLRFGLSFSFDDGLHHGRELLRLADRPTAVVCGNDLQAFGVYEAARQVGLRIPDELSVIGFDDIAYAQWAGPALTTVRQPFAEMGAKAASLVLALAAGQLPPRTRTEVETTLIVRDSTAPPVGG
ncbi:LacI family DNA-binding transcriptional regulator [Actinophytocola sp.]|uniref:LacI family DNA-binding transcriptional regulator n=1 Tax=Actinophytocola sp. TaxID=1872138 RepID=UPI002D80FE25|nr:LacI family DNA-binding transcriptional regulator [Actinophytocola sp.]HET9141078.1 LacI family DNA-binding transcriptional regulator [Actinophytocola sp.]